MNANCLWIAEFKLKRYKMHERRSGRRDKVANTGEEYLGSSAGISD